MKKVNFRKLRVEVSFDEFQELDVAKELGNYIHSKTPDIGVDETARAIYHSDGDIEISDEHAAAIVQIVTAPDSLYLARVKTAIKTLLSD